MNPVDTKLRSRRVIWLTVIALSLCLISLGIRIPNLENPHQPKHRPRAVIEAPHKVSKVAPSNISVPLETCPVVAIAAPTVVYVPFQIQDFHQPNLQPLESLTARAPPIERV